MNANISDKICDICVFELNDSTIETCVQNSFKMNLIFPFSKYAIKPTQKDSLSWRIIKKKNIFHSNFNKKWWTIF